MNKSDAQTATEKLARLKGEFQVDVLADWGDGDSRIGGAWQAGSWVKEELDKLYDTISLLATAMGGSGRLARYLGGVTIQKTDIGSHAGEALAHQVSFSKKGSFGSWTVVHEFAHAWDANHDWKLSRLLEKYTGGFTNRFISRLTRGLGRWDAGPKGPEKVPGRYGRRPGCNAAGYFYGDKPTGSNWKFNRLEDFAESVAMYVGWGKDNALTEHAHNRVVRYEKFKNGEKDFFGVEDNWADYAKYFYPEGGDYTKTKRWKFVDDLVNGRIQIK
jgi:hypothetical protein